MLSEDELAQAREVSVREIAGVRLKKASSNELNGPCPHCGGDDRFIVWPKRNRWYCRRCDKVGDAIALKRHISGCSFHEAVEALIGKAPDGKRRQPTPNEIAARLAREEQRRREEAEEQARNASSAARIVARLQPIAGTPGEAYLSDVRCINVSHWAIRRVLEGVEALGWCERTCFWQPDPSEPFHELHGQWLGAIIGILTDPISAEPTGGITRTYLHQGRKIGPAKSLGGFERLGIIRLSPDDEVLSGLHLTEGIESGLSAMSDPTMNCLPLWAAGSRVQLAKFPVLAGVEFLTAVADNDEPGIKDASAVCQRWANAGRKAVMKTSKRQGEDANDILIRRARA